MNGGFVGGFVFPIIAIGLMAGEIHVLPIASVPLSSVITLPWHRSSLRQDVSLASYGSLYGLFHCWLACRSLSHAVHSRWTSDIHILLRIISDCPNISLLYRIIHDSGGIRPVWSDGEERPSPRTEGKSER